MRPARAGYDDASRDRDFDRDRDYARDRDFGGRPGDVGDPEPRRSSFDRPEGRPSYLDARPEPGSQIEAVPRSAQGSFAGYRSIPVPCTVLRPRTYDEVAEVARIAVSERKPVVLVLRGCPNDLARRFLDFSFGICCGTGASMKEIGDQAFVLFPQGVALTTEDMASLRRQGIMRG